MTPWSRQEEEDEVDDPFRLVVAELFLPRAESERERDRERKTETETHGSLVHTHSDGDRERRRERERERTRDAHGALRGGGKRRKEEKKDGRSAAQRGRTHSFHLAADYSTSRSPV